jgi:hypothetical protein
VIDWRLGCIDQGGHLTSYRCVELEVFYMVLVRLREGAFVKRGAFKRLDSPISSLGAEIPMCSDSEVSLEDVNLNTCCPRLMKLIPAQI